MRERCVVALFVMLACWLCCPGMAWARIQGPEGGEDLDLVGQHATFIFHAHVVNVTSPGGQDVLVGNTSYNVNIADLAVDRWYKGTTAAQVRLKYIYPALISGHDCIDLERASSWLIFASRENDGTYVFSDNCEGGLPVSSFLAPVQKGTWLRQMQADMIAGLQDPDPALRLASIARLGGLHLRSSGDALRPFVEYGSRQEMYWAVYAALRSGDPSVLPRIESMLAQKEKEKEPHAPLTAWELYNQYLLMPKESGPKRSMESLQSGIWYEVRNLRNAEAIPALATLVKSAKDDDIRNSALSDIGAMATTDALPALFSFLHDNDQDPRNKALRLTALQAIANITGAPDCRQQEGPEASIEPCKNWWEQANRAAE